MRNPAGRKAAFAALFLFLASWSVQAEFEITAESVSEIGKMVAPLVEKETGIALKDRIRFSLTTPDELEKIICEEVKPQFRNMYDDEKMATEQRKQFSRLVAQALVAKYVFGEKRIVVCPENIDSMAKILGREGMFTRESLSVILVHECVHAADDVKYGFSRTMGQLEGRAAVEAFNAVVEGHAQHVTRKICIAAGWEAAFEEFTENIGKVPPQPGMGEAMNLYLRLIVSTISSAYYDGESFIRAIAERGGEKAVQRAFSRPPADYDLINNPEWFLDPASRPKCLFEFDSALEILENRYDKETWSCQKVSVNRAQLEIALTHLPRDEVQRILVGVKQNRIYVLKPKESPQSKCVIGSLIEFDTPAAGAHAFEATRRLLRIKDEKMKKGMIRIKSSSYETIRRESWQGVLYTKEMAVVGEEATLIGINIIQGRAYLELAFSTEEVTRDALLDLAEKILSKVRS